MPSSPPPQILMYESPDWVRLVVRFPLGLHARLSAEADRTLTPMAVLVREAVATDLRGRASARVAAGDK